MKSVYIVAAKRTPLGSFGGSLMSLSATELGSVAIQAAHQKLSIDPLSIKEIYFGNVCSANLGQAPARQAAIKAGLHVKTVCTTINKVCASGMKATMLAAQNILLGERDIMVSGGMESMSNIPYYMPKARWGSKYGHTELIDGLQFDGLTDAYSHKAMGMSADATALRYEISRQEQDAFAIRSYTLAAEAHKSGAFNEEIIPISIQGSKGKVTIINIDEEYTKVDFDKIPNLKPVFNPDGTVTAANASTINDGAAALILVSEEALKLHGLKPLARIVSFADAEQEPEWFTTSPGIAAPLALKKAGLTISDIDYFEINEAFAVVVLAFTKMLQVDINKVNIHGGAVALGHPLGASGARILTTLINVLKQKNAKYGLAAICNGGGGASAMVLENLQ